MSGRSASSERSVPEELPAAVHTQHPARRRRTGRVRAKHFVYTRVNLLLSPGSLTNKERILIHGTVNGLRCVTANKMTSPSVRLIPDIVFASRII